ncbi:MAG: hypothetical protein DA408_14955 [Bacteroidetes bacterium]|nr:MAG: hypothetical protein DA408_14955 [Bacteroidota bacterium]
MERFFNFNFAMTPPQNQEQQLLQAAQGFLSGNGLALTGALPAAWLIFLWALARVHWETAAQIWEVIFQHQNTDGSLYYPQTTPDPSQYFPPIFGGLLPVMVELAPDPSLGHAFLSTYFPKVLTQHLWLQQTADPAEEGLLHWVMPAATAAGYQTVYHPAVQTFWIWSCEALIALGGQLNTDVLELITTNELSIFQMEDVLWQEDQKSYLLQETLSVALLPTPGAVGFLPLFAHIPDQDRAEKMLAAMKSLGYALQKKQPGDAPTPIPWSSASAFLIYRGLLNYEMEAAAAALKLQYLNRPDPPKSSLVYLSAQLLWTQY